MSIQVVNLSKSVFAKPLCAVILAAIFITAPSVGIAEDAVSAEARRPTVLGQIHGMKNSLTRLRKAVEALQTNSATVSSNVSDVKNSLTTLNQRVVSGTTTGSSLAPTTTPTPAPTQTPTPTAAPVIASSSPTSTWVAFDKYQGRTGQMIVQHNKAGVVLLLKIFEAGKSVQEYKLNFPFAGRSADQKAADAMVITTCMSQFARVFDAADGSFFINASTDDTVGILCASDVYSK
jgi:hypothetical protein